MAGFRTHISTSALLGVGYGAVGHSVYGMPLSSSVLSAGLCTVAGILPDVDSDYGHSLREVMAFLAAVVPMLLWHRVADVGYPHETLVLMGALVYLLIRFGLTNVIRRFTVHRGMWHSIPSALIAGLVTYCLCDGPDRRLHLFKSAAVVAGFIWHLILDEVYAVDTSGFQPRVKRSFGTAIKVFGNKPMPNVFVYGLLLVMIGVVINTPSPPTATVTPEPELPDLRLPPAPESRPFQLQQTGGRPGGPPDWRALSPAIESGNKVYHDPYRGPVGGVR